MIYIITNRKKLFDGIRGIRFSSLEVVKRYFGNKKYISCDTETTGFDPYTNRLLTVQVGDIENQFIIDCDSVDIRIFKDFFESDKIFIFQNAKFDLRFFLHSGIIIKKVFDTFLAEAILTTGIKDARKGLDFLAYKYANASLNKDIRGDINKFGLTQEVIKYAADDVKYLEIIKDAQLKEIRKFDLYNTLALDNKFVLALSYIEYCGMYLNKDKWLEKIKNHENKALEYKAKLNQYILESQLTEYIENQLDLFSNERKCTINWDSPQQVIRLFKKLGITTITKDKKTGLYKDSVESHVLKPQMKDFPLIELYLDYKEESKEVSTYGTEFFKYINPKSNRIHSQFNQVINTGRMSSNKPNIQNIPATTENRACFTAEEDNVIISSDYSAQETIVLTNASQDKNLIEFYEKGLGDLHSWVASLLFEELKNLPLSEIKSKHGDKRQLAKGAGFAIQYGGNGRTISENLSVSEERGEWVYNSYMNAFPDLKNYFEKVQSESHRNGYITFNQITKRKSFFDFLDRFKDLEKEVNHPNFWNAYRIEKSNNSDIFHEYFRPIVKDYYFYKGLIDRRSLNYPIQGTSADITKYAAYLFYKYILQNNLLFKVKIINMVHDEILVESPESISKNIAKELSSCMEKSGELFCKTIKLKAKPEIETYWKH